MYTLFLKYTIDPNKLADWRAYAQSEGAPITESGGKVTGYYGPTEFSGATSEAFATQAETTTLSSAESRQQFFERQRSRYAGQLTVYASFLRMLLKEGGLNGGASKGTTCIRVWQP